MEKIMEGRGMSRAIQRESRDELLTLQSFHVILEVAPAMRGYFPAMLDSFVEVGSSPVGAVQGLCRDLHGPATLASPLLKANEDGGIQFNVRNLCSPEAQYKGNC